MENQILVALGANLEHPIYGSPINTLEAAVEALEKRGLEILAKSRWYKSAPVPISDQPWFVNGVVRVGSNLSADALLAVLHDIESEFGRVREIRWEARVLDLDLIAYGDQVTGNKDQAKGCVLPHPNMHVRSFVLLPMKEMAENWVHPVLNQSIDLLIEALDKEQIIEPV